MVLDDNGMSGRTTDGGDFEVIADGDSLPVVPEGLYVALAVGSAEKFDFMGGKRVAVSYRLIEGPVGSGESSEHGIDRGHPQYKAGRNEILPIYYPVGSTPDGRLKARANTKYRKAWVIAADRKPARGDRMSPKVFEGKFFLVKVALVKTDSDKDPLGELSRYSVVRKMIRLLPGYDLDKECGKIPY